jgi:hypothetical protein
MATIEPPPAPDPSNAPPSDWTEPLDPDEVEEVARRLQAEQS